MIRTNELTIIQNGIKIGMVNIPVYELDRDIYENMNKIGISIPFNSLPKNSYCTFTKKITNEDDVILIDMHL